MYKMSIFENGKSFKYNKALANRKVVDPFCIAQRRNLIRDEEVNIWPWQAASNLFERIFGRNVKKKKFLGTVVFLCPP